MADRPLLDSEIAEADFLNWYWTMAELQPFARSLDVSASGSKAVITERIAAALGGRAQPLRGAARAGAQQLEGPISRSTVIPRGQRSTVALREFFEAEIGLTFRFNGHMRTFLSQGGATLGDAVAHWHATVGTPLPKQSESLEFNQFTKDWHRKHPNGSATECRAAWATYRALPKDQRPLQT